MRTVLLPHRSERGHAPPPRTMATGALLGATAGAIAGALIGDALDAALLALAGAFVVVAVIAAAPARGAERERRVRTLAPHPAATPTTTLALPPPGRDAEPGWYPDPDPDAGDEAVQRLWDGEAWTEHRWAPRG